MEIRSTISLLMAIAFRRNFSFLAALLPPFLFGGCTTFSAPLNPKNDSVANEVAALSPRQKYFSLSENRWFEIETTHDRCYGRVRYIDRERNIEGKVGFIDIPRIIIESDNPDIVVAGLDGHTRLILSTDGGRTFHMDKRSLPGAVAFISVRDGNIRVGIYANPNREGKGKGYLEWGVRYYYEGTHWDRVRPLKRDIAINGRHAVDHNGYRADSPKRIAQGGLVSDRDFDAYAAVVLEAPISKFTGEIGFYRLIRPAGFSFDGFYYLGVEVGSTIPDAVKRDVREVASLEELKLPKPTDPIIACEGLDYPPRTRFGRDANEFFEWYWKTKEKHPEWPGPDQEKRILNYHEAWKKGELRWMPD